MLGGTKSRTSTQSLAPKNHAWGATSTSYLPAVNSLSGLKGGSNHWSTHAPLGNGPWHVRAPPSLSRTLRFPTPPCLSRASVGRGRAYADEAPGEGTLEDEGATNCQFPPPCGFFSALAGRAHTRPALPSRNSPGGRTLSGDSALGEQGEGAQLGSKCRKLEGTWGPKCAALRVHLDVQSAGCG